VVLRRVFNSLAESNPSLAPLFMTLSWGILGFALFTWIAEHVANALLLLHPLGRHALRRWEKRGAAGVALSLLLGGGLLTAWLAGAIASWIPALVVASFSLPLGAALDDDLNRRQRPVAMIMAGVVIAIGLIGLAVPEESQLMVLLAYGLLWVAFTWLHQIVAGMMR